MLLYPKHFNHSLQTQGEEIQEFSFTKDEKEEIKQSQELERNIIDLNNPFSPWYCGQTQAVPQELDPPFEKHNSTDSNCNEDDINLIKKKLDFSRLSQNTHQI